MSEYPRKVQPGDSLREALCAEQINAIIDGLSRPTSSSSQPKIQEVDSRIDWMTMLLPCKTGSYPIALDLEVAKHVRSFVCTTPGVTASLKGAGFASATPPAGYQNLTSPFRVRLGSNAATAVSRTPESAEIPTGEDWLYVQITAVPTSSPPPFLKFQIGFAR